MGQNYLAMIPPQQATLAYNNFLHIVHMQQTCFFGEIMKNLTTKEVGLLFLGAGCELLSEYVRCDLPVNYRCVCGVEGEITLDKFRRRLKNGSGCKYCKSKKWSALEDECLRTHYGKIPRKQLLDLLPGVTYQDIKNRAYKLGLKGNVSLVQSQARSGKGRKYSINFSFFDKIDPLRSYWAGFIAATGDLNEERSRLSIRLLEADKDHLELFKETVGYTGQIFDLPVSGTSSPQVLLQCHGVQKWLDCLRKNYFLTPRKSLTLQPPIEIDEENSLAFIAGYIDGKGKISSIEDNFSLQITGTQDMLCWMKVWFDRLCPSVSRRFAVVRPVGKDGTYRYTITGHRASYLLRRLKGLSVPKLVRKWKQVG